MQTALELYYLANQGARLEGWSSTEIERCNKYAMGNHHLVPEALIRLGEKLAKSGSLRLPANEVIFDFNTPDQKFQRLALLCWHPHDTASSSPGNLLVSAFIRADERWSNSMLSIQFSCSGEVRRTRPSKLDQSNAREFMNYFESMAYALTIGALSSLKLGAVTLQLVSPESNSLHKKRFPFYQVDIHRIDH